MTGNIFNIQRFSTNDGPGIRTVVFFKGCPLSCAWCHNPESKATETELFFDAKKCILCRACESACERGLHKFAGEQHLFSRSSCNLCIKCAAVCPSGALLSCGDTKSSDEISEIVLRDLPFYEQSQGGVTLSGGEPLMQYEFALELLKKLKQNGIHTAIETSGYCRRDLSEINEYVDLWLYDIKLFPVNEHIKFTGKSNETILKNLFLLDGMGAKIILRCPIIPGVNFTEKHLLSIAQLAKKLKNLVSIQFEPYHPLGIEKAAKLGKKQKYESRDFLTKSDLTSLLEDISDNFPVGFEVL